MRLLCLANSYKEGGRCIAGILLDDNDKPILKNNQPIWIRPVCKADHGQIPNNLCNSILPLDIIQINGTSNVGAGYQSENTVFDEKQIIVIGKVNKTVLNNLYSTTNLIFGNREKSLLEDVIKGLNHSLLFIRLSEFIVDIKKYEDSKRPKIRLCFSYNNNFYDFPVTDPVFLDNYSKDKTILNNKESIDVVLSLGFPFKNLYYKLVATIIY